MKGLTKFSYLCAGIIPVIFSVMAILLGTDPKEEIQIIILLLFTIMNYFIINSCMKRANTDRSLFLKAGMILLILPIILISSFTLISSFFDEFELIYWIRAICTTGVSYGLIILKDNLVKEEPLQ